MHGDVTEDGDHDRHRHRPDRPPRRARHATASAAQQAVTAPKGNLALVNTQWITGDPDAPAADLGRARPVVAASEGPVGAEGHRDRRGRHRGRRRHWSTATRSCAARTTRSPSEIVFSETVTGFVIASEEGDYALRVWDANSEAIQEFGSIDAFDFNPEWIIQATFTPIEGGRTVGFEHLKDDGKTRDMVIPGEITFTKDGIDYNLAAFKSGRALQLVFADTTNGDSTYSVGRFLFVAPNADGTVTLDFNLAVLPPCAFSYNFNCPLPPAQNRFSVPIEAGEKNVLDQVGRASAG